MKTFLRIIRALFIRLIFIAFSLLCIWRVTFVSDNKFYWLMMISVGFLLIETAVLLWLRAGKEFRGILPSVLFFLACVLPSIWIISVDEANRKVRFHQITNNQESSIRDYVMSLDIVNSNNKYSPHHNKARILANSSLAASTRMLSTTTPATTSRATITNAIVFGELDDMIEKRSAPNGNKFSHRKSNNHGHHNSNTYVSTKVIERGSAIGVECCDVKISYLFREDSFQTLFFQTLMLILCISRWLITRAELNLNQRSLILVISVATAADTLDFFGYLGMPMVYTSWHLLYSVLLIVSLSLVQFVFLHVEDDCLTTASAHAFTSAHNTVPTKTGHSLENDNGDNGTDVMNDEDGNGEKTCKGEKGGGLKKKTTSRFSLFNRQYAFLKRHLKAEESLKKFNRDANRFGHHHMAYQMPTSPSRRRNAFTQCICSSLCCCLQQRDPLLFILLASIFLHDGSYLTFRLFALTKLGLETILLDRPLLIFFLAKNVLIICTQIYKVYAASGERRERRIVESYRELMMAAQQQQQQMPNDGLINTSHGGPSAGFLPLSQSAAIAAAATGGQIPLVGGLSCFQANAAAQGVPQALIQSQLNQSYFNQQGGQLPISSTNNPYRFAQLYNDPFSAAKPCNRSQSTLGSPNQNYFSHTTNTLPYASNTQPRSKSNMMDMTANTLGPQHQQYYQNNASTISYQSQQTYNQPASSLTSPYTESLLGMMNKEFNNNNNNTPSYSFKIQQQQQQQNQQQYDSNITMCAGKQQANRSMFLSQQQFISGSRGAKTGPTESSGGGNVFSHSNNFRNSGSYVHSNTNYSANNTGKILKASKI